MAFSYSSGWLRFSQAFHVMRFFQQDKHNLSTTIYHILFAQTKKKKFSIETEKEKKNQLSNYVAAALLTVQVKETPQLIGLFSQNLVITNFMQCFLYGPIG